MPEMDGYTATYKIRGLDNIKGKTVPIIAMTANVFREDVEKCFEAGMNDHIGKPIDPDIMYRTIKKHITSFGKMSKSLKEIEYGIAWNDDLSLGNEQVDTQHHQMFELLSSLVVACADGTETAKLKETLDFLVNYTVQHLIDEEALMLQYNYPGYDKHKELHNNFKETISGLEQRFTESGSSDKLSGDVNRLVARWLINHIFNEDKKIGMHIRSIADNL
jgi:hemerythrin-like metal-binding protein